MNTKTFGALLAVGATLVASLGFTVSADASTGCDWGDYSYSGQPYQGGMDCVDSASNDWISEQMYVFTDQAGTACAADGLPGNGSYQVRGRAWCSDWGLYYSDLKWVPCADQGYSEPNSDYMALAICPPGTTLYEGGGFALVW